MDRKGIALASLEEAFSGSEDVLGQMFALFLVQAHERLDQLREAMAARDAAAARAVLHSLVNIGGAVRAYGMSDLAKAVGDAIKAEDWPGAAELRLRLEGEGVLVLAQAQALADAARGDPASMWRVVLPGPADLPGT